MFRRCTLALLCLLFVAFPCHAAESPSRELLVCGADEVYALNLDGALPTRVWRWKAKARIEMPIKVRARFYNTDECKPVGDRVLITSSGGATALVERRTGKAVFWALTPYAHSAELLPGSRLVVACSTRADKLAVFDVAVPEKEVFSCPLRGAHGVVWDEARKVLWSLSDYDLTSYRLVDWDTPNPSLSVVDTYKLPKAGGHDLYPVPHSNDLIVTANSQCWYFDREKHEFRPITEIAKPWSIKSICIDPLTHQMAYVQAEKGNWWAENIHILPDTTITLPGRRIYKARWTTR